MRTGLIAATAVALVVGVSALLLAKDEPKGGGGSQSAQSGGGFKKVATVQIKDFKFVPPDAEVKVGEKIEFANQDDAKHTATSKPQGTFDAGDLVKGKPKPVTFTKAGTFNYYCVYHAFMKGKVKVVK